MCVNEMSNKKGVEVFCLNQSKALDEKTRRADDRKIFRENFGIVPLDK